MGICDCGYREPSPNGQLYGLMEDEKRRLIPLFSNGTKAKSQLYYGPFLTLVDHEDLLDWVQDKGDRDHNGPDTHTCACHPEHEKGHQDLFRW